jgi:hypothetical protein
VLAQAHAEGNGVKVVFSEAGLVSASDLEHGSRLAFGQGPWGAFRHPWGWRRCLGGMAMPLGVVGQEPTHLSLAWHVLPPTPQAESRIPLS